MKKAVLWGCAEIGTIIFNDSPIIPFEIFVDRRGKTGISKDSPFFDKDVITPDVFFRECDARECVVFVCAFEKSTSEIIKELEEHGYQYPDSIVMYQEIIGKDHYRFIAEKLDYIHVLITSFFVTDFCTLRCKECSLSMPYRKEKRSKSLEEMRSETELYFSRIDYTDEVTIVGGEPLLWKELENYILWLTDRFSSQYGQVRVITNGTIQLSEKLQDVLLENNVMVEMTYYPDIHPNFTQENIEICNKRGIAYKKICHDFWMDFAIRSGNYHADRDNKAFFQKCDSLCRGVDGENLIYCTPGYFSAVAFDIPYDKGVISMKNTTKMQLYDFYHTKMEDYPKYCGYCNGYSTSKHIPVAEQIEL